MTYPGGKAGDGVYQAIINQLPPHDRYIEGFVGAGVILRLKRPAVVSIAIDVDVHVTYALDWACVPNLAVITTPFLVWLEQNWRTLGPRDLMYLDPPYLFSTRKSRERVYLYEMGDDKEHRRLLRHVRVLRCMVAISGYPSKLYDELLPGWRCVSYPGRTRAGWGVVENLWMNYPEPVELHDYSYLGSGYRERERIKKKKLRWLRMLAAMPLLERRCLAAAIAEYGGSAASGTIDGPGGVDVEKG